MSHITITGKDGAAQEVTLTGAELKALDDYAAANGCSREEAYTKQKGAPKAKTTKADKE